MIEIRKAELKDLPAITEIYNEAVLTTASTFDTEPKSMEDRKAWLEKHDDSHPVIVAEEVGIIKGWASLSKWSEKKGYSATGENSIYVKEEYRGKGIGKMLLKEIIKIARKNKLHTVIANIADGNYFSIKMHMDEGFSKIGIIKDAGTKFGKLIDVHLLQLFLD